jgi:hypothetical protein
VGEGAGEPVSEAMDRAKESVEQEVERAKGTADEVKATMQAAVDHVSGPPADSPEQARRQLAELRAGLDHDLATLRDRVPDPNRMSAQTRTVAMASGGGLAVVTLAALVVKRRSAKRRRAEDLQAQAKALARELARVQRAADEAVEDLPAAGRSGRGRWLALLGLVAGAVAVWQVTRDQRPPDVWEPPYAGTTPAE